MLELWTALPVRQEAMLPSNIEGLFGNRKFA